MVCGLCLQPIELNEPVVAIKNGETTSYRHEECHKKLEQTILQLKTIYTEAEKLD